MIPTCSRCGRPQGQDGDHHKREVCTAHLGISWTGPDGVCGDSITDCEAARGDRLERELAAERCARAEAERRARRNSEGYETCRIVLIGTRCLLWSEAKQRVQTENLARVAVRKLQVDLESWQAKADANGRELAAAHICLELERAAVDAWVRWDSDSSEEACEAVSETTYRALAARKADQ